MASGNGTRRIVVTGLGVVSPLGCGVEHNWTRLTAGENGFGRIQGFEIDDLPCQIAAQIPRGDGTDGTFNPDHWMEPKEQRKVDDFILFAVSAATQALSDAGWKPSTPDEQAMTGVMFGSGIGGLGGIYETSIILKERGPRRVSPFFITGRLINLASGYVSIEHGLKGPNHAVVTACSSGAHAIGDAARLIAWGDADVMVAGGAESAINRIGIAGFSANKALCTKYNDRPEKGSRPYDRDRDGFVMGEGAGALVLEEYEHAKARGAKMYAELIGYGLSGDAFHITAPPEDGDGAYPLHADGDQARRHFGVGHRLHQRTRHIDDGRYDRAWRGRAADGQCGRQSLDVVDEIGDRASARCGRRGRGGLRHSGDARRHRTADA